MEGVYVLIRIKREDYNKDKICTGNKSIYESNLSNNTLVGEVKRLSKEEIDKYLKEQSNI